MSLSDVIYEEAEKMESVWESGYSVGVFEGEEKGIQEGRAQGIIEGIEKGVAEERKRSMEAYIMMIESKKITKDDLDELPINDELRSAILDELSKRGQ